MLETLEGGSPPLRSGQRLPAYASSLPPQRGTPPQRPLSIRIFKPQRNEGTKKPRKDGKRVFDSFLSSPLLFPFVPSLRRSRLWFIAPTVTVLAVLLLASCTPPPPMTPTAWTRSDVVFGTIPASLTVYGPEDENLFQGFLDILNNLDKQMSMWDRPYVTDVMRLAQAAGKEWVELGPDTAAVLKRALEIGEATDGALDVAIGPLVKAWGVATDTPHVPPQKEIDALLPLVNRQDIVLEGRKAFLKKPGMIVDLGGIAKGYAADQAVLYLKSKGVTSAIVDLGGNVYVLGSKPDGQGGTRAWRIGIQDPLLDRGEMLGFVSARDTSLVTSGVYERKFTDEATGKVYHHILDPKTGWPTDNGLVSVTVVSQASMDCDGFAKVIVLGLERGLEVLRAQGLEGIFITADKKVYVTPGLAKDFSLTAKDYQLADLP